MKTRTFKTLIGLNLTLLMVLTGGLILDASIAKTSIDDIDATQGNYVLTFNSENNIITTSSYKISGTTTDIYSSLGNNITFKYEDFTKAINDNQWQRIHPEGSFYNSTQISGIEKIDISVEGTHQFEVHYSYFENYSQAETKTYSSLASSEYTIEFKDMKPNFIKLVNINTSLLAINSLTIHYSCTDSTPSSLEDHPVVRETYNFGYYPQSEVISYIDLTVHSALEELENDPNLLKVGEYIAYDGNLYLPIMNYENEKCYFKVEPVQWIVVGEQKDNGEYFFISRFVLDFKQYDSRTEVDSEGKHPSDYASSDIREWLNGTMYDTLFNEEEKKYVVLDEIDNSSDSTRSIYRTPRPNPYAPENNPSTQDYVYLPCYYNLDGNHGFDTLDEKTERQCGYTYYAGCIDALTHDGKESNDTYAYHKYWTRSPYNDVGGSTSVSWVDDDGTLMGNISVSSILGVRPMITYKQN